MDFIDQLIDLIAFGTNGFGNIPVTTSIIYKIIKTIAIKNEIIFNIQN